MYEFAVIAGVIFLLRIEYAYRAPTHEMACRELAERGDRLDNRVHFRLRLDASEQLSSSDGSHRKGACQTEARVADAQVESEQDHSSPL